MNHVKRGPRKKGALSLVRSFAAQAHLGSNWIKQASGGPGLTWALICGPLFPVNSTLLLLSSPHHPSPPPSLTVCQPKAYVLFKSSLTTNLSCCLLRASTLKIEWGWYLSPFFFQFVCLFLSGLCDEDDGSKAPWRGETGNVFWERFNDDSCWRFSNQSFLVCMSKCSLFILFYTI